MRKVEDGDVEKRIETEVRWCFTFKEGKTCVGASGRKLRQTCIWCPNYKKEKDENEKSC